VDLDRCKGSELSAMKPKQLKPPGPRWAKAIAPRRRRRRNLLSEKSVEIPCFFSYSGRSSKTFTTSDSSIARSSNWHPCRTQIFAGFLSPLEALEKVETGCVEQGTPNELYS